VVFLSTARFQQLELEKKKSKTTKPVVTGAKIRYHSFKMSASGKDDPGKSGKEPEAVDLLKLLEDGEEKAGS